MQEVGTIQEDSQHEQMDIRVDIEPPIVNYINLDHSYCQTDVTRSTKNKPVELKVADNDGCETVTPIVDDVIQTIKKRKPQQSLLKTSILKKIRIDTADMQSISSKY